MLFEVRSTTVPRQQRQSDPTVSGKQLFRVSVKKGAGPECQGSSASSERQSFPASSESIDTWAARQDARGCAQACKSLQIKAQSERYSGDCIVEPQ